MTDSRYAVYVYITNLSLAAAFTVQHSWSLTVAEEPHIYFSPMFNYVVIFFF